MLLLLHTAGRPFTDTNTEGLVSAVYKNSKGIGSYITFVEYGTWVVELSVILVAFKGFVTKVWISNWTGSLLKPINLMMRSLPSEYMFDGYSGPFDTSNLSLY